MALMEYFYLWKRPNNDWAEGDLPAFKKAAMDHLDNTHGPFSLSQDGDIISKNKTQHEILERLYKKLDTAGVGPVYRIRDKKGEIVFTCREGQKAVQLINTNGNTKADQTWTAAIHEFPFISFLGAYVCKHIAGTYNMSQHSYGNAIDLGCAYDRLQEVANWFVSRYGEYCLDHVIYKDNIWTRGEGWHHYTGEYHYHVHLDFTPQCSGSCGVKETGRCQ